MKRAELVRHPEAYGCQLLREVNGSPVRRICRDFEGDLTPDHEYMRRFM